MRCLELVNDLEGNLYHHRLVKTRDDASFQQQPSRFLSPISVLLIATMNNIIRIPHLSTTRRSRPPSAANHSLGYLTRVRPRSIIYLPSVKLKKFLVSLQMMLLVSLCRVLLIALNAQRRLWGRDNLPNGMQTNPASPTSLNLLNH